MRYGSKLSKIDACDSRSYVATFPRANEPVSEAERSGVVWSKVERNVDEPIGAERSGTERYGAERSERYE